MGLLGGRVSCRVSYSVVFCVWNPPRNGRREPEKRCACLQANTVPFSITLIRWMFWYLVWMVSSVPMRIPSTILSLPRGFDLLPRTARCWATAAARAAKCWRPSSWSGRPGRFGCVGHGTRITWLSNPEGRSLHGIEAPGLFGPVTKQHQRSRPGLGGAKTVWTI